ncbi:Gfo/Idh/MocA family protein [Limimaricola pyoseonensis]|uniref:Predicted dehydrogenase n=1 Tax=Limimaricola pyoseonensis TaxID=521013 RepID=A0A1G7FR56_9RHOB|nr:Gfo/Idh/MocA family oxidoreductase [Limimaricola pyoseonensis]SDE78302.1 Predicted dehydrogenase [Limimaricola pyoseonensis]
MTLRVGLIGLGEVAQLMHLPLLADDPRYEIAAVSDLSAELTETIGRRYGAGLRSTDPNRLLEDPDLDAVFLLTPDQFHAPQLEAAIAAGKHVFVEKPACLTEGELRPLLGRPARGVVFVGYMRRYARPFLALRDRMPAAETIRHVRIRDLICEAPFFTAQTRPVLRPRDLPDPSPEARALPERLVRAAIGAEASREEIRAYRVLTGLASHSLSAMRDLLGPPRGIVAACQRAGGESVSVIYDYGHFVCSYEAVITDIPVFDAGIEILTNDSRYALTTDTPYIRNLPTRLTITGQGPNGARSETIGPFYEDPFRVELDAFHAAVTEGAPVRTGLEDSLHDLELIAETARAMRA